MNQFIVNIITPTALVYLAGAFIAYEWDVSNWTTWGRISAVIIWFAVVIIAYADDVDKARKKVSVSEKPQNHAETHKQTDKTAKT